MFSSASIISKVGSEIKEGQQIGTMGRSGANGQSDYTVHLHYEVSVDQSRSKNHLGGYDLAYNKYNFTGNLLKTLKEHNISGQSAVTELYEYAYDHALRPTTTTYTLNNKPPVVLSSNKYDEFGRLEEKKRHSNADTEEFEYNIRSWITKIISGNFEQNLYYNTGLPQNATACFNGNIAYNTWKYNGVYKGYLFSYDNLNRLTSSHNTDANHQYEGNNSEEFTFDKMGNITSLWRTGNGGDMDNLSFGYDGNQIQWIFDDEGNQNLYNLKEYAERHNSQDNPGTEFFYDSVGNMTADLDRDIVTIKYNLLNLPELIQFKNGCQIKNTYSADGQKLSARYITVYAGVYQPLNPGQVIDNLDVNENENVTVDGTDYVGNIEYHIDRYFDWDITYEPVEQKYLYRVHNPEGYASSIMTSSQYGPVYNYYRKDHLGNNREVWNASYTWGSAIRPAATSQRTQYYASGLPWKYNTGDNPGTQPYKYNGKEFVEMHGYDSYDYGARVMYPAIGPQFMSVDPLAEKYYSISPYAYCLNNPVKYVDPDGREIVNLNGSRIYNNGEWSGNDIGARRIGEALMKTPVGKELFNQMVNSTTKVMFILDPGVGDGTKNGTVDIDYTNNAAKLTIFEGMAEKKLAELNNAKDIIDQGGTVGDETSDSDKARLNGNMPISVEEIIGQKAVHEAVHIVDEGSQRKNQPNKNKREELPVKKETEAVEQTPEYRIYQP